MRRHAPDACGDRGGAVLPRRCSRRWRSSCRSSTWRCPRRRRCTSRPTRSRSSASTSATRCWRSRSISIWGYCGILSLGHAAFFSLGGYAMGMYLMRQIGTRGVYGDPVLPDFMVFLNWKELPWFWYGFDHFWFALLMVVLVPGAAGAGVRLARVPLARHRRLPVDHHAGAHLRADARVLPQRHGLRRQQRLHRLQGHPRLRSAARRARASCCSCATAAALAASYLACRAIVASRPAA